MRVWFANDTPSSLCLIFILDLTFLIGNVSRFYVPLLFFSKIFRIWRYTHGFLFYFCFGPNFACKWYTFCSLIHFQFVSHVRFLRFMFPYFCFWFFFWIWRYTHDSLFHFCFGPDFGCKWYTFCSLLCSPIFFIQIFSDLGIYSWFYVSFVF